MQQHIVLKQLFGKIPGWLQYSFPRSGDGVARGEAKSFAS